jgi:hypothetical protein
MHLFPTPLHLFSVVFCLFIGILFFLPYLRSSGKWFRRAFNHGSPSLIVVPITAQRRSRAAISAWIILLLWSALLPSVLYITSPSPNDIKIWLEVTNYFLLWLLVLIVILVVILLVSLTSPSWFHGWLSRLLGRKAYSGLPSHRRGIFPHHHLSCCLGSS